MHHPNTISVLLLLVLTALSIAWTISARAEKSVSLSPSDQYAEARNRATKLVSDLQLGRVKVDSSVIRQIAAGLRQGPTDVTLNGDCSDLITVLVKLRHPKEAHEIVNAMFDLMVKTYPKRNEGGSNPNTSSELECYSQCFSQQGLVEDADEVYVDWINANEKAFGAKSGKFAGACLRGAAHFADRKMFDKALNLSALAVVLIPTLSPEDAEFDTTPYATLLANDYMANSRFAEAERFYKLQIAIMHRIKTPGEVGGTELTLAEINDNLVLCRFYVATKRLPDAQRFVNLTLDCVIGNLPQSKKDYAADIRQIVDAFGVAHRLGEVESMINAVCRLDQDRDPDNNSYLEEDIARAYEQLRNTESAYRFLDKKIEIEKRRMPKAGTTAYLVQAYEEYARLSVSCSLPEKADWAQREADKVERDWAQTHNALYVAPVFLINRPPPAVPVEHVAMRRYNPYVDILNSSDDLKLRVQTLETNSREPTLELCQKRSEYCNVLGKVGDFAEQQIQLRILLAEQERLLGKGNPAIFDTCMNMLACSRDAKDPSYYKQIPHLVSILGTVGSSGKEGWRTLFRESSALAEDNHFDEAYSLAMASIKSMNKEELTERQNFAVLSEPQRLALVLASNHREEQGDQLSKLWMQTVRGACDANSVFLEHAYLSFSEYYAKSKKPVEATTLVDQALKIMKTHAELSDVSQYGSAIDMIGTSNKNAPTEELKVRVIDAFEPYHPKDTIIMQTGLAEEYANQKNYEMAHKIIFDVSKKTISMMKVRNQKFLEREFGDYLESAVALLIADNNYQNSNIWFSSLASCEDPAQAKEILADWFLLHGDFTVAGKFYLDLIQIDESNGSTFGSSFAELLKSYAQCLEGQHNSEEALLMRKRAAQALMTAGRVEQSAGQGFLPTLGDAVIDAVDLQSARLSRLWSNNKSAEGKRVEVSYRMDENNISLLSVEQGSGSPESDAFAVSCLQNSRRFIRIPKALGFADFRSVFSDDGVQVDAVCIGGNRHPTNPNSSGELNSYYWGIQGSMQEITRSVPTGIPMDDKTGTGCLMVQFEVSKLGAISNVQVLRSLSADYDPKFVKALSDLQSFGPVPADAPTPLVVEYFVNSRPLPISRMGFIGLPPMPVRGRSGMVTSPINRGPGSAFRTVRRAGRHGSRSTGPEGFDGHGGSGDSSGSRGPEDPNRPGRP